MDWLTQYADPSLDWNEALIMLVVRFIGVFVVMLAMQVTLVAAARGVRFVEARGAAGSAGGPVARVSASSRAAAPATVETVDDATVAAIGVALALERGRGHATVPQRSSSWGTAGRMAQLDRQPWRRR
jgi:hypothetical protein